MRVKSAKGPINEKAKTSNPIESKLRKDGKDKGGLKKSKTNP